MNTRLALVAAALAGAFAPIPPALVERWYSSAAYPALQGLATRASNTTPFALFDALVVGGAALWVIQLAADVARE